MAEKTRCKLHGEGTVYPSKGKWVAKYQNRAYNGGRPIRRTAPSQKEAYAKLEQIKQELFGGKLADGMTSDTVEEYMTRWLFNVKRNAIKAQSFDRLESTVRVHVVPQFGCYLFSSLNTDEIQDFLNGLYDTGKSHSTVKKIYDALNDCCKYSLQKGDIKQNPVVGVTLRDRKKMNRKKRSQQVPYYTFEEERKLIEAAISTFKNGRTRFRMGWAIPFVLNTGLRVGELAALQWEEHIDFAKRRISVESTQITVIDRNPNAERKYVIQDQDETKSESGQRVLEMNQGALEAIRHLQEITGSGKYVVATQGLERLSIIHLDRMMEKVCKFAGLAEERTFGMHALRHTFASKLFAKNVDVKIVSALLGHCDVKITYDTYIHLVEEQRKTAIHIIDEI